MADIQERLIFSSSVKPFPIKEGNRVLVHEGSLYKLDKKKKHKVYAMLFTDLLLLTKEVGQHLKVVQEPMFLSQIMIQDFTCDDGTEFHITVVATLPADGDKVIHGDTYVLRAKTTDSKEVWKMAIGERASGVDRIRKQKEHNIHTLPCIPGPSIPPDSEGTSEDERIVDDGGIYGVTGISDSGSTRPCRPGRPGRPSVEQYRRWNEGFDNVLNDPKGEAHFMNFLIKEYATENYDFWNDVKQLKKKRPHGDKLKKEVKQIYDAYIGDGAKNQINVNGKLKNAMLEGIENPNLNIFDDAQKHVYALMKDGAYKRFQENIQDILRGHG